MTTLTTEQIAAQSPPGWAHLVRGLQTRIATPDFATGLRVVDAIGAAAEEMDHHPDLDLRYSSVSVRLTSHDAGGVTERDIRLAATVTAIAAAEGLQPSHQGLARLELALDTPEQATVLPFWEAVLGLRHHSVVGDLGDELVDKAGQLPTIWFQGSGHDEPRQRWHPDVWVDPAEVHHRIDAALGAGGRLVSDEAAPRFWVLADVQGNQVCLCTSEGR